MSGSYDNLRWIRNWYKSELRTILLQCCLLSNNVHVLSQLLVIASITLMHHTTTRYSLQIEHSFMVELERGYEEIGYCFEHSRSDMKNLGDNETFSVKLCIQTAWHKNIATLDANNYSLPKVRQLCVKPEQLRKKYLDV